MLCVLKELNEDGGVPLANSVSVCDTPRVDYLRTKAKQRGSTDQCPFRHGECSTVARKSNKQSKAIQINRLSPSTCLIYVILMQALVIDDEKPDSAIEEWVPQISRSFSYWQIIGSQLNQPGGVCMAGISWQPDLKPQGGGNSR